MGWGGVEGLACVHTIDHLDSPTVLIARLNIRTGFHMAGVATFHEVVQFERCIYLVQ